MARPLKGSAPADAGALPVDAGPTDRPYHHLSGLPRELWRWAVVCSSGESRLRLPDLIDWQQALMRGQLPATERDFGDQAATQALRTVLAELELPALTRQSQAVTRQVLQSLLWHLDSLIDRPAHESRSQAIARMQTAFRDSWDLQCQGWEEALALLPSLGDLAHLRWDDLAGQLNRREWAQARQAGALLQRLPDLARFIDGVGRRDDDRRHPLAEAARPDPASTAQAAPQQDHNDQRRPEPAAVDGVRFSRNIARMAGSESLNLTHPVLHRLWRARFAESRLLTYDDRARDTARSPRRQPDPQPHRPTPRPAGMGPMLVCLDTSGSMRGAPENVAKACVLQALRSAHLAYRPALLLAFGGPDELLERPLAMDATGLDHLLDLMGQNFDGGTDVQTPIERAIALVQTEAWREADLLLVSDGEFGVTPDTLKALRDAKERLAMRAHGILIGDRETIGLAEVCDHLYWVREWRRYGDGNQAVADGFSPVHSRSLSAIYFPNAIRR